MSEAALHGKNLNWSRPGDLNPGPSHYEAFGNDPQVPAIAVSDRVLLSISILFHLESWQNRGKVSLVGQQFVLRLSTLETVNRNLNHDEGRVSEVL